MRKLLQSDGDCSTKQVATSFGEVLRNTPILV